MSLSTGTEVPKFPLRLAKRKGVKCAHCRTVFKPTNTRGPVPAYCSRACQAAAWRERQIEQELEAAA